MFYLTGDNVRMTVDVMTAGVSGEEDQGSGQRTAVRHEGPEESHSER